jgi:hypothetical protein
MGNLVQPLSNQSQPKTTILNQKTTFLNQQQPISTIKQPYLRKTQQIDGLRRHDRYEYKTLRVFPSYPCQRGVPFETPASYGRRDSLGVGEEKTATRL